jgi:type I restriction enzyme S subunit
MLFPLPPLEEQKEIVKVVDVLFKEVEQLEQLTLERIALKEDFVTSALNQLTTNTAKENWTYLQAHFKSFFNETTNIKKLRETVLQLAVQGKLTADWRTCHPGLAEGSHHASELLKRIQEEKARLIKDKKIKKEKALPAITDEEIPYELPDGWVWCRFGDLITFLNGYAFKSSTYVPLSEYQIIRLGNVKSDNFLINTKEAYVPESIGKETLAYQLCKNDILTTLTGTKDKRDYCYTCIVKEEHLEDKVLLLNQRVGCIRAIDKSASELLNKFLKSEIILNQLFVTETGTANQGNIGSTSFKNLVFPHPPLEEQKAIVEKVNALMELCDGLEQGVQESEEHSKLLMKSCLREVFEGEIKTVEI